MSVAVAGRRTGGGGWWWWRRGSAGMDDGIGRTRARARRERVEEVGVQRIRSGDG